MTKMELLNYVKENKIDLEKHNIFIGSRSNIPYSMGCYEEAGKWIIYEVGERQNISVVKEGSEEEVFKHMYYKIRGRIS